ncbi:MAG TPA: hypothetical protein VMG99_08700 [Thermoplasmata archaeon]|nr:hypothetical protein [Thermoplasmata archaeon]
MLSVVVPVRSLDGARELVPHIPPGADEIVLAAGAGIAHARNGGARRARGDVLLHTDDDVVLRGDLSWFARRPDSEMWWIATNWSTTSADAYTRQICALLNLETALRIHAASVGSFQVMRRWAFAAVGGYDEDEVHEDIGMGRRLYRAFGPPTIAPIGVEILRRTVTAPEHWQRHATRGPVTDGPYLRLVPATTSRADRSRSAAVPSTA